MLSCTVFGHRYRFSAEGKVMRWSCQRGCGAGGEKVYPSETEAARYASAFDRDDVEHLGHRGPLIALLPLRVWHWLRRRGQS